MIFIRYVVLCNRCNMMKNRVFLLILTFSLILFFSCTDQSGAKGGQDLAAKYPQSLSAQTSENSDLPEGTDGEESNDSAEEKVVDYSRYHAMSFYSEETIDDLYDAISYVVYIDDLNGHPMVIKDGESYYEVTGVGHSPSDFTFDGEVYSNRFYAQTVNGVYMIGVALRDPDTYLYSLRTSNSYGITFVDVYDLYRY